VSVKYSVALLTDGTLYGRVVFTHPEQCQARFLFKAIAFESKPGFSTRVVNVRLLMTFVDAAPDPPSFAIVGMNGTWAKVAWEPSRSGVPGSVFYVQYRPRGQCSS